MHTSSYLLSRTRSHFHSTRRAPLYLIQCQSVAGGRGFAAPTAPKDLQTPKGIPTAQKIDWESPLSIIRYPDPRLRAANAKVGIFGDQLLQLAKEMTELMYQDDGVGLAAPQVGVNIRMMIFNPKGREGRGEETILVNPEIVTVGAVKAVEEEGCLSFPKIYAPVERPRDIVVRAQNEKGEAVQFNLGGDQESAQWVSRIFQHEYDHLQGILFHDRMKSPALESIREPLVALEEEFVATNPGVPVKRIPPPKKKGF